MCFFFLYLSLLSLTPPPPLPSLRNVHISSSISFKSLVEKCYFETNHGHRILRWCKRQKYFFLAKINKNKKILRPEVRSRCPTCVAYGTYGLWGTDLGSAPHSSPWPPYLQYHTGQQATAGSRIHCMFFIFCNIQICMVSDEEFTLQYITGYMFSYTSNIMLSFIKIYTQSREYSCYCYIYAGACTR